MTSRAEAKTNRLAIRNNFGAETLDEPRLRQLTRKQAELQTNMMEQDMLCERKSNSFSPTSNGKNMKNLFSKGWRASDTAEEKNRQTRKLRTGSDGENTAVELKASLILARLDGSVYL